MEEITRFFFYLKGNVTDFLVAYVEKKLQKLNNTKYFVAWCYRSLFQPHWEKKTVFFITLQRVKFIF